MNKSVSLVLSIILFLIGLTLVVSNPGNSAYITFGMFLVAISLLSALIPAYFPKKIEHVRLKLIEPERLKRAVKGKRKRKKKR